MENSTKVRNVKSLLRDLNKGTYNLNHIVQRSASQWSKKQQESLLDSIINKNIVLIIKEQYLLLLLGNFLNKKIINNPKIVPIIIDIHTSEPTSLIIFEIPIPIKRGKANK